MSGRDESLPSDGVERCSGRPRRTPLIGSEPQARLTQSADQFTRWGRYRTGLDHAGVILGRDVVVVAVEALARDSLRGGEGMQLVEALVAHEVGPHATVCLPDGLVDAHGHQPITARNPDRSTDRGPRTGRRGIGSDGHRVPTMSTVESELRTLWRRLPRAAGHEHRLDALLTRLAEPHRRYHSAAHVLHTCRHVTNLARAGELDEHTAAVLPPVLLAALYHDAVYRAGRTDLGDSTDTDEHLSALLASETALEMGWTREAADLVEQLVMVTLTHSPTSAAEAVLVDADLAILGGTPAEYAAYVVGVRSEYAHVDDTAWKAGRAAVLRRFLDAPAIFRTLTMRAAREERARANLTAELAGLER